MANRPANYLLQQLSQAQLQLLSADMRNTALVQGAILYEDGDAAEAVYFPESGLLSVITTLASGAMSETNMVGREGAFGFVEALGSGRIHSRVVVQIAGAAWVVSASRFRKALEQSEGLRNAIRSDTEMQLAETRQSLTCNSRHGADQRLARWLLEAGEKSGAEDTLPLTHEYLSIMLSVQRSTISATAAELEGEGLIRQRRGRIEVANRVGLERRACECRGTIAALRQTIMPNALQTSR